MAKSDLELFYERERQDLAEDLEPHRALARELDVYGQAALAGWCELAQVVHRSDLTGERGASLLEFYKLDSAGYAPDDPDPEREVVPIYFGTTINGLVEDINNGSVRVDELRNSLANFLQLMDRYGGSNGSLYGAAVFAQVLSDLRQEGFAIEELAPAAALVIPWQRLVWLIESGMRQGAVLAKGRGEPLVGDSFEQLAYLLRLAANQPGLGNWPELARFVPRRAENLLPLSEQAYRRFRREGIPDDPELAERLVSEILERRHYVLDAISVIELEELGVRRIVMTPEERPDSMVKEANPQFMAGFLVDHVAGTFSGTITIGDDGAKKLHGRRAVVMVPSILEQEGRELEALGVDSSGAVDDVAHLHEAQAAVELLVLSAWRDLVVPDVRDQHYEIDRVRKAKGGGGARAAKRGNLEVVRYIPRRVVYRRAAREAAEREGKREPMQVYAVGAFSRRLPQGQKRSADADAYAKEIGIPVAPHQTVVKPHFRGGTEEERERAMDAEHGLQVRHWKSWSALDLLRTRAAQPSPEEVASAVDENGESTV
jgi:hypothetical protein